MSDPIVDPNNPTPPVIPPTDPTPPVDPPAVDPVIKRFKDDLFREKKARQDAEDENKRLKEEKLKASKNFEELAKTRETERDQEKAKREALEKAILEREKVSALRTEALKQGIRSDSISDLDLLDFPEIDIETTSTGKIIVHGAAQAVQGLKAKRPHWFTNAPPSINPASPETTPTIPGELTVSKVLELEAAYKKSPSKENKLAYEEAMKKIRAK